MGKKLNMRTADEIERDRILREKYQRERPSLADLVSSGEYSEPMRQRELFGIMEFAARIKALREQSGLSLADLETLTGIDKAALSRLENGQVDNPTYSTLDRVAKALKKRLRLVLDDDRPVGAG